MKMLWYRLFGGTLPVKSRRSGKPSSLNDASVDARGGGSGGDCASGRGTVAVPEVDGAGRGKAHKGRGRGRGRGMTCCGSVVPPPAKRRPSWLQR